MITSAPSQQDELLGQLVMGRYRIVRPLGRGGMGVVYLARLEGAAGFSRPVVIKRIVPDLTGDTTMSQLFVREARILSNLQHAGIVSVVDFGEENLAYVMVLEYVHGYNLGQWHRYVRQTRGQMPIFHANHIIIKMLEALHFAHTYRRPDGTQLRIIHRDVSPSNILLDLRGVVKLHDFGIARTEDANEFKTTDGTFKGKLAFTPPEVFSGEPASPQSDLYACGVVLYQLLTSQNPFRAKEMGETVSKVLTYTPPPISAYREEVPDGLDEIVARSLAKKKEDRFATAAEFADALRALCPLKEEALIEELGKCFAKDFAAMPTAMHVDSLEARDGAWREAQEVLPPSSRLPLSSWPPNSGAEPTIQERTAPHRGTATTAAHRGLATTAATANLSAATAPNAEVEGPGRRGMPKVMLAGIGVAVLMALGALVVSLTRSPEQEKPRFLLLEKTPTTDTATPAAAPSSTPVSPSVETPPPNTSNPLEASPPSATNTAPSPPKPPKSDPSQSGKPDPRQLSRTFASQQGKIQGCFRQHAANVTGQPQVSVRFHVSTGGQVTQAEVIPGGLATTPLGQCILTVAQAVKFGPQSESIVFAIPITARRVDAP